MSLFRANARLLPLNLALAGAALLIHYVPAAYADLMSSVPTSVVECGGEPGEYEYSNEDGCVSLLDNGEGEGPDCTRPLSEYNGYCNVTPDTTPASDSMATDEQGAVELVEPLVLDAPEVDEPVPTPEVLPELPYTN